ncbi:hypothetical protein DPMN_194498 [Dreissena polymorpha]|uniref:Sushi domain-containing protein n=1 Tax=Dreissena polymorpha TaxID=45954 RepID=A0A9D3Y054_DREPO|nr:hypothetical protein DPMN_194498 [Dreissena polymorpha]
MVEMLTVPEKATARLLNGTTYLSTAELTCINGYRLKDGHNNNSATLEHIKCTSDAFGRIRLGCE